MQSFRLSALLLALALPVLWPPGPALAQEAYPYCAQTTRTVQLLIDRTDPYDDEDRARLSAGLYLMARGLGTGDLLVVRRVGSVARGASEIFRGCMPGCPDDLPIWERCDRRAVATDRNAFGARLADAVSDSVLDATQQEFDGTALTGTIREVLAEGAPPDLLVIFSDFLEYVDKGATANFYSFSRDDFAAYLDSLIASGKVPALNRTSVIAFGLHKRLGKSVKDSRTLSPDQWQEIEAFWRDYFRAAGTRDVVLRKDFPQSLPTMPIAN